MTEQERNLFIDEIRKICKEIGCSGMSSACMDDPTKCSIIREILYVPPSKL